MTDTILRKISQAFENINKNDPARIEAVGSKMDGRGYNLYSFKCPSIIYHNGYFWMLSNESNGGDPKTDKNAGKLRLVISNSKDLGPFAVWCGWVCQVVTVLRSSLPQVR